MLDNSCATFTDAEDANIKESFGLNSLLIPTISAVPFSSGLKYSQGQLLHHNAAIYPAFKCGRLGFCSYASKKHHLVCLFVCPLLDRRQRLERRAEKEEDVLGGKQKPSGLLMVVASQCGVWLSRGRKACSECPQGSSLSGDHS